MTSTSAIVQKLWNLCNILKDDGVTYHQYVTELTLLLFLKMAKETDKEERLPDGCRWDDLRAEKGNDALEFYKRMLLDLASAKKTKDPLVRGIYSNSTTAIREPRHLHQLIKDLDALEWFSAKTDGLADLYEGLLEKNASEFKKGAGQYFTPRPLINAIVAVMKPEPGEVIQDPAAGTAGFLIAADTFVKNHTNALHDLPEKKADWQRTRAYVGVELVPEARRLALMNCLLHDIGGAPGDDGAVRLNDTLSSFGCDLEKADVILTNPPFGTKKGGGKPTRSDFTYQTSNKQLAFVEHVYRGLKAGGRAAVVVPDDVLFEENDGKKIRGELMEKCSLHTILRLPTGIFYAPGVKTNVLFFTRGTTDKANTDNVWIYDLRANAPSFGKRTPFTREFLEPFVKAYGDDPNGHSKRHDEGEHGRFRRFSRDDLRRRNDNLNVTWLAGDGDLDDKMARSPDLIADELRVDLQAAQESISELQGLIARIERRPNDVG